MKILVLVIGILALIAGLAVFGLVAGSGSDGVSKMLVQDARTKASEAQKTWEQTRDPKAKADADKWLELEKEAARTLQSKESERQFGFIAGGVIAVIGLGLVGLSFVVGRKE